MSYGSSEASSSNYSPVPTSERLESSKLVGEEVTFEEPRQNQWRIWALVALVTAAASTAFTFWSGPSHSFMPSSSSSTSDSTSPVTPDGIYGGGWTVVRCVSSTEGSWHPATDNLYGTESYGTYVNSYTMDTTFSTTWSPNDYSTALVGLTDLSAWVVVDTSQLYVLGKPVDVEITESSVSSTSYTAEWSVFELFISLLMTTSCWSLAEFKSHFAQDQST